jgi:hypothetical protein
VVLDPTFDVDLATNIQRIGTAEIHDVIGFQILCGMEMPKPLAAIDAGDHFDPAII